MRLVSAASGRVARVKHLQNALALRPDHLQNIVLEYRIAVAMSQHGDPPSNTLPNPLDGIPLFRALIEKYNHMDYYDREGSSGTWDPHMMVPRARVHLASLLLRQPGSQQQRRELTFTAMEEINQTFQRRRADWLAAPRPAPYDESNPFEGGEIGKSKWKSRVAAWERQKAAAQKGDVLSTVDVRIVKPAVRQYGYSYGRQRPHEVASAMGPIIEAFPDTPMARIAQGHIDRANKMIQADAKAPPAKTPTVAPAKVSPGDTTGK